MRHFLTILAHEIRMLLVSPSTYIAAVLFLIIMGYMFAVPVLGDYTSAPQDASPATVFFNLFWVPVLFMVPLLTMKSIAEERRLGTLETLLTTPVSTVEVILGKFGAAYFLYLSLWGLTVGFFLLLNHFARDARLLDPGPLIGGYLFIAVSGLLFVALGIFASSLSRNQAVAGILCFTLLMGLCIGPATLTRSDLIDHDLLSPIKGVIEYSHVLRHLEDFTRGIIDARQLIFYLSGAVLALIFSILGVEAKLLQS